MDGIFLLYVLVVLAGMMLSGMAEAEVHMGTVPLCT